MLLTTLALVTAAASLANAHTNHKLASATLAGRGLHAGARDGLVEAPFSAPDTGDPNITTATYVCPWAKAYLGLLVLGTAGAVVWVAKAPPPS